MRYSGEKGLKTLTPLKQINGVCTGRIVEITKNGEVMIDYDNNTSGKIPARFTRSLKLADIEQAILSGQSVLLLFENNDPARPIIIDIIHSLIDDMAKGSDFDLKIKESKDVTIDGKSVTFDAKDQIVLRCGKASITLTKKGKVLIRGAYLLSRSTGVNKIKGGSVHLN